jgi:hypothetical protein
MRPSGFIFLLIQQMFPTVTADTLHDTGGETGTPIRNRRPSARRRASREPYRPLDGDDSSPAVERRRERANARSGLGKSPGTEVPLLTLTAG